MAREDRAHASHALLGVGVASMVLGTALAMMAGPGAGQLGAQDRGAVVGIVVDGEDLTPLGGSTIRVHEPSTGAFATVARTDDEGRFVLEGLPPGPMVMKVDRPGYIAVVEEVEVTAPGSTLLQVRLPRLTVLLDGMGVSVEGGEGRREARTEGEILRASGEDETILTAADLLLRHVPGIGARLRGVNSIFLDGDPAVYLDDVRIDGGAGQGGALRALEQIPASAIRRIRVLRGPASSVRYPDGASGMILVETLAGGGGSTPPR